MTGRDYPSPQLKTKIMKATNINIKTGWVLEEPEYYDKTGKMKEERCSFTIKVPQGPQMPYILIRCVAWGKIAQQARYLKKNDFINVIGYDCVSVYMDQGKKKYSSFLTIQSLAINCSAGSDLDDDDLPNL